MSRGGRGGFGGAAGGGSRGELERRLGLDDPAVQGLIDTKPSETFPKIDPPIARPPDHAERASVHNYRTLRARIHDGPFYCILDPSARVSKSRRGRDRTPPTALFNPFEGQQTYSQRFKKQRNHLPNLHKRPFVKEYFPQELWDTIGVDVKGEKTHQISKMVNIDKWADAPDEDEPKDENMDEDADEEKEDKPDEEDKDDEEEDKDPDQFDEDDEDEDDDYNAEQYFEGGEDDDAGYGDEGGGEDDY
ncbi:hypothetical protein KVT40_005682 [Elsinoe batatas]|uniref:DNA-directed RNA polymerase III subunit n=1 Tax=Elsinoe batatas TaxID=2601811 RepID=A0A8K0L0C2_9PEZI|nr:hypothetical protein KVT40_005682 [Elsinoe batatas]